MTPPRIVLASASPRRRALLQALGLEIEVLPGDAEETFDGPSPEAIVIENARRKSNAAAGGIQGPAILIAADTLVFLDGHVLGKPASRKEAFDMLSRLQGRAHHVLTGLAVTDTDAGRSAFGVERTEVCFRALTPAEINAFIDAVNPLDRAGAYTVDGPGSLLVAGYHGCYHNVLGLPIVRLDRMLRELGHTLFDWIDPARARFL
jgi:septum formation protein